MINKRVIITGIIIVLILSFRNIITIIITNNQTNRFSSILGLSGKIFLFIAFLYYIRKKNKK